MDIEERRTEQPANLPFEIIQEILPRLAVKSLLRLRCVSKSWLSLIDSDQFIRTHLQYSTKNTDFTHIKVVFNNDLLNPLGISSIHALLNKPIVMDYLWCQFLGYNSVIVGCCDGLICILKDQTTFFLLNPATGISKELPRIDGEETLNPQYYGLGWDESSGAYKVFVDMFAEEGYKGKVYSSKTNSWKTVEHKGMDVDSERGQFVGGKLHWNSTSTNRVCYFDLKTEVFGTIELPSCPKDGCDWKIGVLGGCLCVVYDYSPEIIDVWLMKESWLKLVTACRVDETVDRNGETLISCESNLLVYSIKDNVLGIPKVMDNFFEACIYIESLVSPEP